MKRLWMIFGSSLVGNWIAFGVVIALSAILFVCVGNSFAAPNTMPGYLNAGRVLWAVHFTAGGTTPTVTSYALASQQGTCGVFEISNIAFTSQNCSSKTMSVLFEDTAEAGNPGAVETIEQPIAAASIPSPENQGGSSGEYDWYGSIQPRIWISELDSQTIQVSGMSGNGICKVSVVIWGTQVNSAPCGSMLRKRDRDKRK